MICSRCRHHLSLRVSGLLPGLRSQASLLHSSTAPDHPAPRQPPSQPSADLHASTPSALSSSTPGISQPLSTPDFPSSARSKGRELAPSPARRLREPSSVPGGSELKGLAYMKNKPSVMAKEDNEYPDWLWGLLENDRVNAQENDGIDPSSESIRSSAPLQQSLIPVIAMNKKGRIRHARKMAAIEATRPKKIPIHEQSIDLTTPDASAEESLRKRNEVTQSARDARRKGIRQSNFLRGL